MEQILDRYRGSRVSATVSYTERKRIIENRPRFFSKGIIESTIEYDEELKMDVYNFVYGQTNTVLEKQIKIVEYQAAKNYEDRHK